MYEPAVGRWFNMDPLAEEYYSFSPYNYVMCNPISNYDPNGEFVATILGGVIGGAVAAIKGGSWDDIWKGAASGAVAGAVVDLAVATGGASIGVMIGAGAIAGMVGEVTHQELYGYTNDEAVIQAGAFGLAGGILAGAVPGISRAVSGLFKRGSVEVGELSIVAVEGVPVNTAKAASAVETTSAAKEGLSNARALGIAGEEAVGVGSKVRIESLTGTAKYRIPDILTPTTIEEVKNVSHLSLTRQLTDFHMFSQQTGRQFILWTRPNTTFSGPLQNLINNGSIITKPIPFK